jgi:hypothetical protein
MGLFAKRCDVTHQQLAAVVRDDERVNFVRHDTAISSLSNSIKSLGTFA